jgi:hypothetical protein
MQTNAVLQQLSCILTLRLGITLCGRHLLETQAESVRTLNCGFDLEPPRSQLKGCGVEREGSLPTVEWGISIMYSSRLKRSDIKPLVPVTNVMDTADAWFA